METESGKIMRFLTQAEAALIDNVALAARSPAPHVAMISVNLDNGEVVGLLILKMQEHPLRRSQIVARDLPQDTVPKNVRFTDKDGNPLQPFEPVPPFRPEGQ